MHVSDTASSVIIPNPQMTTITPLKNEYKKDHLTCSVICSQSHARWFSFTGDVMLVVPVVHLPAYITAG